MANRIWKTAGVLGSVFALLAGTGTLTYASERESAFDGTYESQGTVTASALRIRNAPSLEGKQIGSLVNGSTVWILGQEGDWYRVDNGDENPAYMYAEYIDIEETKETVGDEVSGETSGETEKNDGSDKDAAESTEGADAAENTDKAEDAEGTDGNAENAEQTEGIEDTNAAEDTGAADEETVETIVPVADGELDLLAAIIQCEAGGESHTGKVAVGAVIMNRINNSQFPNSISEVVYQKGQFSPVASGILASVLSEGARSDCYEAAEEALTGSNPVGSALYFNSGSGKGQQIGNQHFY
jgi:N-acetylmuramoyl-L-alanine amidase